MSKYVAENYQTGATLGYTTYYFAEYSGRRDDLKTIKINDIVADYDSIKSSEYPFVSFIYIGIKDINS